VSYPSSGRRTVRRPGRASCEHVRRYGLVTTSPYNPRSLNTTWPLGKETVLTETITRAAEAEPAPEGKARWTRLAALGLVLAALGPILFLVAGVFWGLDVSEDVPFFGIAAAVALIGAFVVARFGGWAKVVGLIVALLLGLALFWTAFGLATPTSFFDFVPGLLIMPGVLIAIVSCIAAMVAARRGHLTTAATGGERNALRIVPVVVVLLAVLSGIATAATRSTVDESVADATVVMKDFEFDSSEDQLQAGSSVLVRNDDPFLHTFTVDDLDIDETLSPGSEELIEIPSEPGRYWVYCRPHTSDSDNPSEDDMAVRLTVE
jgi:plastocyanin